MILAYGDFKDLAKTTVEKIKHLTKDPKYDGYQRGSTSMV